MTATDLSQPSASTRGVFSIMRASSWFLAANVFAGLFNYLYQVLASRELSALEFSELNAWFANLALFFLIGGLLQYAANFFPAPKTKLRQAIVAINIFALALIAAWMRGPEGQTLSRALMVLAGSALFGWLIGQAQGRLLFFAMTVGSLLVGICKVALAVVPFVSALPLERYCFALFACYLPALWWISLKLWNDSTPATPKKHVMSWRLWAAPAILSTAAAVIPQMDMVLMNRIQSSIDFQEFARASLFYKGIYFLMFIVAQWLLPQQIRESQRARIGSWIGFAGAAIAASVAITALSPAVVQWILQWDHSPPMSLIFLSCLNMSLLTWIFFEIQSGCSRHQTRAPAIALGALGLEAILQLSLALSSNAYLIAACIVQAAIIACLTVTNSPKAA